MRFTPTSKFLSIARGVSKVVVWKVYAKSSITDITEALSAGTWKDITSHIANIPDIVAQIENDLGQFKTQSLTLQTTPPIGWWDSVLVGLVEIKIECQIGLSSTVLATDVVPAFSGFVRSSRKIESENRLEVKVYGYDEYGRSITAESITFQPIHPNVDGASTQGLILVKILGIYVTNAAVVNYTLKAGIHTIHYDYNAGTETARLDDGAAVTLSTNNFYILTNAALDQQVQIRYNAAEEFLTDGHSQDIVVTVFGATLPSTWFVTTSIHQTLALLFAKIGITTYTFDSFRFPTHDGRNVMTMLEMPVGDVWYGLPNVVLYDELNGVTWIGVNDKIYKRNMTTNVYTAIGVVSAGYKIMRFWPDKISLDELWGLARDSTGVYKLFKVTITTSAIASQTITNRATGDTEFRGAQNFAFAKNYGAQGAVYWCKNAAPGDVYIFDINLGTEVLAITLIDVQWDKVAWSDGTDYLPQYITGGNYRLRRIYYSGAWTSAFVGGSLFTAVVYEGAFLTTEGAIVYSYAGGATEYFKVDGASAIVGLSSVSTTSFEYRNGAVHCYIAAQKQFATVQSASFAVVPNALVMPDTRYDIVLPYAVTYDWPNRRFIGLLGRTFAYAAGFGYFLFEFWDKALMTVDLAQFTDVNITEAIAKICNANLLGFIITSKRAFIYRRFDQNGTEQNSGNSLTLNRNVGADIEMDQETVQRYDVIEVTSGSTVVHYDGQYFGIGVWSGIGYVSILSLENSFINPNLVRDIAFNAYRYFRLRHVPVRCMLPQVTLFQFEPYDRLDLSFTAGSIRRIATSTVRETTLTQDGSLEVMGMVAVAGQFGYGLWGTDVYA